MTKLAKNILTVGEHEVIYVSDIGRDILRKQISVNDMRTLLSIDFNLKSTDKQVFRQDGKNIRTQSFVGSIQIDQDLIIEILPKFIKTNKDLDEISIRQYRETLMNMIMLSGDSKFLSSENVALKSQNGELPMFEALIYFFAEALSNELRKGLHREYIKMSDNLKQIKGRLVIQEHLRRNMFDLAKLYVEFESYSIDNNLMRIFKASIRLLMQQHQISPLTKQKLSEAIYLLNDVSDFAFTLKDFETITFHRMNSRFEELFAQCRFLIMKFYPFSITADSKTRFWSILFDMDELFEDFLAFLLRRSDISFEDQYSFHAYRAPYGSKNVGGRPDFVFFKENSIISVADAKWKLYDPARSSSTNMGGLDWANFWQLTSYMYLLNREPIPGYFIVPAKSKDVPREVHYQSPREYHADIAVLTIDFTMPISDILETHRFSWENDRLRLSAYMTAKLWIARLVDEFDKIRITEDSFAVEDENFYPYLCHLRDKTKCNISALAALVIASKEEIYTKTTDHIMLHYGSNRSAEEIPYIELLSYLNEVLTPIKEPVVNVTNDEVDVVVKKRTTSTSKKETAATWDVFDTAIDKFYIDFKTYMSYSQSMYMANIEKIRSGEMKKPPMDVKYFSLGGKKIVVFLYSEKDIKIRIEYEDKNGITKAIKKSKLYNVVDGYYTASVSTAEGLEATLSPLKWYLMIIVSEHQMATLTSETSPSSSITPLSKEDFLPAVIEFKEKVNFLTETLLNKTHHLYTAEHDIQWRSKNAETQETTARASLIIENVIYASALRMENCVLIELYDIDPEAFSISLYSNSPMALDGIHASIELHNQLEWLHVSHDIQNYLNRTINNQKNSIINEALVSRHAYNPAMSLRILDSSIKKFTNIYTSYRALQAFIETSIRKDAVHNVNNKIYTESHSKIIDRFASALPADGTPLSLGDIMMADMIFSHEETYLSAIRILFLRQWALTRYLDRHQDYLELSVDTATAVLDGLKKSKQKIALKGVEAVREAIGVPFKPSAGSKKAVAAQVLAFVAYSNLTDFPPSVITAVIDALERINPNLATAATFFSNGTIPLETAFNYYFGRVFYKDPSEHIQTAINKAEARLVNDSTEMKRFVQFLHAKTEGYTTNKIDWHDIANDDIDAIVALGDLISKNSKVYFVWRALISNTENISFLENIFEASAQLTHTQKGFIYTSLIRAKIYGRVDENDLERYKDLLHKLAETEESLGENYHEGVVATLANNYSIRDATVELLFNLYHNNDEVLENLIKIANNRPGDVSEIILNYVNENTNNSLNSDNYGDSMLAHALKTTTISKQG